MVANENSIYIGSTVPFRDAKQRALHFRRHGHEFGATDELQYEGMSDAFMTAPMNPILLECVRITEPIDRLRLNVNTRCFGVAESLTTVVKTMHIRDAFGIAHRGGPAGFMAFKQIEVRP